MLDTRAAGVKGHALAGRDKQKDAYDIYYCVRNYPDGIEALAHECCQVLGLPSGKRGFGHLAEKFDSFEGYGPTCVRRFVENTHALGERMPEQWQQDAFGQIEQGMGCADHRMNCGGTNPEIYRTCPERSRAWEVPQILEPRSASSALTHQSMPLLGPYARFTA